MNYRHIYHAGNFADVFKHIVLTMVLAYLREKDKPFFVLDTHAGIGLYDLTGEQAQKTNESAAGIGKLWDLTDLPDAAKPYVDIVRGFNPDGPLESYPGSPLIIQKMLRAKDRFIGNELHPEDHIVLRKALGRDYRVDVENKDGYKILKSILPPHERRGMVLIDPPFEVENEFDLMVQALKDSHERWATGTYIFWYPIKDIKAVRRFQSDLAESGIPDILTMEFMIRKLDNQDIFSGSGLAIVNPPWILKEQAGKLLPWLVAVLTGGKGSFHIRTVAGE